MEKPNKNKSLFLKLLPKAANFQNPPFSPGRYHHHHHHHHSSTKLKSNAYKGFSGPINFSVLPDEAREKPKDGRSYDPQEPTSPKVSCMGQIKYKHKKKKLMKSAKKNDHDHDHHDVKGGSSKPKEMKKSVSSISKFFSMRSSPKPSEKKSSSNGLKEKEQGKDGKCATQAYHHRLNCPSLGQMRKFASGRESLANFDWRAQIAPIDHDREYFSDEETRRRNSDYNDEENHDVNDEVIIPFSAPILMGGKGLSLERPRKEVNLWKRRTIDPPQPLTLKT